MRRPDCHRPTSRLSASAQPLQIPTSLILIPTPMTTKLQTLYGLKFNPFRPDIPAEALYTTPSVNAFIRRVELGIAGGGYVMVTGEPGTGKSVALRLLAQG